MTDDVADRGALNGERAEAASGANDKALDDSVAKDDKDDDVMGLYADIQANSGDRKHDDEERGEQGARGTDERQRDRHAGDKSDTRDSEKRHRSERDARASRDRDDRRSRDHDEGRTRDRDSRRSRERDDRRSRDRDDRRHSDRREERHRSSDRDRDRRHPDDRHARRRDYDDRDRRRDRDYDDRDRRRDRDYDDRDRRRDRDSGGRDRRGHDHDERPRRRDRDYDDRDRRGRDYDDRESHRDRRDHDERRPREREGRKDEYVLGGYTSRPRARGSTRDVPVVVDPFAEIRKKNAEQGMSANTFEEAKRIQEEQRARARQMVLQQQATSAAAAASKTQREVYIGNLQQGKVTEQTLRQLFDEALSTAFPQLCTPGVPPVRAVAMHSEGRYAFVELTTSELATAALNLSGQLSFLGSQMTVGRPSGYIDPSKAQAAAAAASRALQEYNNEGGSVLEKGEAPPSLAEPSECVCVEGMVTEVVLSDEAEFQEMVEDLKEECGKFGEIVDHRIPKPPPGSNVAAVIGQGYFGKVYILMDKVDAAVEIVQLFQGRQYDGRRLAATFIKVNHFYQLPLPGAE